jgi:hypothetical protein
METFETIVGTVTVQTVLATLHTTFAVPEETEFTHITMLWIFTVHTMRTTFVALTFLVFEEPVETFIAHLVVTKSTSVVTNYALALFVREKADFTNITRGGITAFIAEKWTEVAFVFA